MSLLRNIVLILLVLILSLILLTLVSAFPLGSCTPEYCPSGYYQNEKICANGTCTVTCTQYIGCSINPTTVYSATENLQNFNISGYSGAWFKSFQVGNFTPNDSSKCYRFRQTTPSNFIVSSDIDNEPSLSFFDSGIGFFWVDYNNHSKWYNSHKNYSRAEQLGSQGKDNFYVWDQDVGAVWVDSCPDDGDNFDSADSFIYANNLSCAPTSQACNNFSNSCNDGCYGIQTELILSMSTEMKNGLVCNRFADFDDTGATFGGKIDFVSFANQTVMMYVDAYDAITNGSFNNSCSYWPQCNPADPCCDQTGNFRSNGYVCKNAYNAVCDSFSSSGCDGHAYENHCTGSSSLCPTTTYEIDYDEVCTGTTCIGQSCSGSTLTPERMCMGSICQTNDAYECPNNLNCLNATACKSDASSNADCRTNHIYDAPADVCLANGTIDAAIIQHDSKGNIVDDEELEYNYNGFNQLANITQGGTLLATYEYDHEGSIIRKVENTAFGNVTTYYFDNFVQIVNTSGTYNESYYSYENKVIGKKNPSGSLQFYHPDILGSTTLITDANGNVVDTLYYNPFGELIGGDAQRYAYTGGELDPASSLLSLGARYYDPKVGKFIQPDPILLDPYNPQDLNKYAYARNNPFRYTDPSGKVPIDILVDIGFIGYDVYKLFTEGLGEDYENLYALGWDIGGAATPYATGFGAAFRAGKLADKASDAGKILSADKKGMAFISKSDDLTKGKRITNIAKSESQFWKNLKPADSPELRKQGIKMRGKGKETHYYKWDNLHNDIEVYDRNLDYKGSLDPKTGELYRPVTSKDKARRLLE